MGVYRRGGGSLDAPSGRACERWEQFRLGVIIYFPWSRSRAVLEGPLSLYIYYTYQLMIQLFGTPRIRSDFRSGSDALPKTSTHSPDRLLTCASSEDFSHSRSLFSLAALESSVRGHSSFRFSTSRSSSKVAYAFRLLVPIVSLSLCSLPVLSSSFYSPAFSPLTVLEPSVSRPDYHLAPFSDRRPTPLHFIAQAHCQHITE